jgi:hypothetical protein
MYKLKNGGIVSRPARIGDTFIGSLTDLGQFGYYAISLAKPTDAPEGQRYVDSGNGTYDEDAMTYAPDWTLEAVPVNPPPVPTEEDRLDAANKAANAYLLRVQMRSELDNLSDTDLAVIAAIFPKWSGESVVYAVDDVAQYNDTLFKVVQAHTSQADWTPSSVPALWTPYRNPVSGPQSWVQPTGAQDAYAVGDQVTHDNPNDGGNVWLYESKIEANTTEPGRDSTFDRYWLPMEAV